MTVGMEREEREMDRMLDMDTSSAIAKAIGRLADGRRLTGGDEMRQACMLAMRTTSLHDEIMQGPVAEECVYRAYEETMSDLAVSASDACRLAVLRGRIAMSEIETLCVLDPWSYHPDRRDGPPTVAGGRDARR